MGIPFVILAEMHGCLGVLQFYFFLVDIKLESRIRNCPKIKEGA